MINKQLETNVNNERLLERLAKNLNIDFITDGSNLKKLADGYSAENLNYATNVDDAIANGFLSTMSSEFLELFGRQYNVYRKNYSNINIYDYQEAITLTVNKEDAMITEINEPFTVYKKGHTIFSDDNVTIQSLNDVVINDINEVITLSVKITLAFSLQQYTIQEGSEFTVSTSNSVLLNLLPTFTLKFLRPVGLALVQEFEEDYRLRLYEATYLANNGANSLVASITKEVPFVTYIETDDYKDGRAIKILYPYTQVLIDEGSDDFLDNLVLPLIQSNLQGKVLYGQLLEVYKPEALLLNISIKFKKGYTITDTYLNNVKLSFNRFFNTYKTVNRGVLEDFIYAELGINSNSISDIRFIFTSPYVSEETFTLSKDTSDIEIPKGRFLHLSSLTKEYENVYQPDTE